MRGGARSRAAPKVPPGSSRRRPRYSRSMRKLLLLSLALTACSSKSKAVDGDEAQKLLIDRNWIDRMPETERDKLYVYRFVPNMGGGVYQDRTIFKGTFELFKFEA